MSSGVAAITSVVELWQSCNACSHRRRQKNGLPSGAGKDRSVVMSRPTPIGKGQLYIISYRLLNKGNSRFLFTVSLYFYVLRLLSFCLVSALAGLDQNQNLQPPSHAANHSLQIRIQFHSQLHDLSRVPCCSSSHGHSVCG